MRWVRALLGLVLLASYLWLMLGAFIGLIWYLRTGLKPEVIGRLLFFTTEGIGVAFVIQSGNFFAVFPLVLLVLFMLLSQKVTKDFDQDNDRLTEAKLEIQSVFVNANDLSWEAATLRFLGGVLIGVSVVASALWIAWLMGLEHWFQPALTESLVVVTAVLLGIDIKGGKKKELKKVFKEAFFFRRPLTQT